MYMLINPFKSYEIELGAGIYISLNTEIWLGKNLQKGRNKVGKGKKGEKKSKKGGKK